MAYIISLITIIGGILGIIQFTDWRQKQKREKIQQQLHIYEIFNSFDKWLNENFIYDEDSFFEEYDNNGNDSIIRFPASSAEIKDLGLKYKYIVGNNPKTNPQTATVMAEIYPIWQVQKAKAYRTEIINRWNEVEISLQRLGYTIIDSIRLLDKSQKKDVNKIIHNKDKALSVRDELLRRK
ncbi:MAG: hypothetical protein H7A34_08280 [bacterium]|nr:hypothetical protein [bacterium]